MTHLSIETLARLVDEPPSSEERRHLAACSRCSDELEGLVEQTRALRDLPAIQPPGEGWGGEIGAEWAGTEWQRLEAKLLEAGLIRSGPAVEAGEGRPTVAGPGSVRSAGAHGAVGVALAPELQRGEAGRSAPRPGGRARWLQAAAALLLFAGGAAFGAGISRGPTDVAVRPLDDGSFAIVGATEAPFPWNAVSLDEAEDLVGITQAWHLNALFLYRDRLEAESGGASASADPVGRFVALENLVSVAEAAVREAPADPFLNGLLVNTIAERQAALEGIAFASTGALDRSGP